MDGYIPVSPGHKGGDNLAKIESILQLIMGLQNDILGNITYFRTPFFSKGADHIRILGLGTRQERKLPQHSSDPRQRRDEAVHSHERRNWHAQ